MSNLERTAFLTENWKDCTHIVIAATPKIGDWTTQGQTIDYHAYVCPENMSEDMLKAQANNELEKRGGRVEGILTVSEIAPR